MPLRLSNKQYSSLTHGAAPLKYGNKKTWVGDQKFDSKWEAQHWAELRLRERAGEIRCLQRQVTLNVVIHGQLVCKFIADFVYDERTVGGEQRGWTRVVADCKSAPTRKEPYYRLKKKLLKVVYGIEIREVLKAR